MEFQETVRMTVDWYKVFYEADGNEMQKFTYSQIDDYVNMAQVRGRKWAG
jgi:hypothetical protein